MYSPTSTTNPNSNQTPNTTSNVNTNTNTNNTYTNGGSGSVADNSSVQQQSNQHLIQQQQHYNMYAAYGQPAAHYMQQQPQYGLHSTPSSLDQQQQQQQQIIQPIDYIYNNNGHYQQPQLQHTHHLKSCKFSKLFYFIAIIKSYCKCLITVFLIRNSRFSC